MIHFTLLFSLILAGFEQQPVHEIELIGVYQGTSLFIQNPYLTDKKEFCVYQITVNNRNIDLNYRMSALKIDFESSDLYTPVTIKIFSTDSLCNPLVINPDAIFFHSSYKFKDITITDSLLNWTTEGERESGVYYVEKLNNGYWEEIEQIEAQGSFDRAQYIHIPLLDEGANKYRIRYEFGSGKYLYSPEIDYDYYPELITFSPKITRTIIRFSRGATYEIFDPNSRLVLSGQGNQVDVSGLFPGDYVIYFNGQQPGVFTKER